MSQVLIGTVNCDGATYQVWAAENSTGGTDFTIKLTEGSGDLLGFFLDYTDPNTGHTLSATSVGTNGPMPNSLVSGTTDQPCSDDLNRVGSNANMMLTPAC